MSKRRRGHGEGSVRRRTDGTWEARLQVGVDGQGRRIRRSVYGKTQREVLDKLDELRQESAQGIVDPGPVSLGSYLEAWLDGAAASRVRPTTLAYYKRVLRPVREQIGGVALRKVSALHVEALLRRLERAGVSARGRQMTYTVLGTALRDAVRRRLLRHNPIEGVARPRAERPEIRHLDTSQVSELLQAAEGDPLEALYALAVGTGLRLGELLGLQWRDADLEAGFVQVRRTLVSLPKGKVALAEPKTARSRRRVDVPGFALDALQRHRERLGATPHPGRLIFSDSQGGPLRRSNLHRRSFKPLLRRAGLPDIPFHALRHTAATLALAADVNPKVVQERLGHSSVTLTLDTYSHAVPTLGRDAAERLDALVRASRG